MAGLAMAAPADAHTELLQAAPGPGQQVGGTVDFVDLVFLDPVTDASVEVMDESGIIQGGAMDPTATDGRIVRFELDAPLAVTGRYDVRYAVTAADGDRLEATHFFVYEPASPQPQRIGSVPEHEDDQTMLWAAGGAMGVIIVVGAAMLTRNVLLLRRQRAGMARGH